MQTDHHVEEVRARLVLFPADVPRLRAADACGGKEEEGKSVTKRDVSVHASLSVRTARAYDHLEVSCMQLHRVQQLELRLTRPWRARVWRRRAAGREQWDLGAHMLRVRARLVTAEGDAAADEAKGVRALDTEGRGGVGCV